MDIFPHIFVVKIVIIVLKEENKLKRGRVRPIFSKSQKDINPELLDLVTMEMYPEKEAAIVAVTVTSASVQSIFLINEKTEDWVIEA